MAYSRRSRPSPKCKEEACSHSKRKHRRGWAKCNVTGCACERFQYLDKEQREEQERIRILREAEYEKQRIVREKRYAEDREKREALAEEANAKRFAAMAVDVFKYASFSAFSKSCFDEPLIEENRTRPGAEKSGAPGHDKFLDGVYVENQGSWIGDLGEAKTLEDVNKFLVTGWNEGLVKMREALGELPMPKLQDVRRHGIWSDVGDTLSLDRLYSGDLETCWRNTKRAKCGAPPKIQLIVEGAISGGHSAEKLFWRGACATTLAEAAMAAGYSVAVDVSMSIASYCGAGSDYSTDRGGTAYLQVTRIKDYDSPVNVQSLAAMTAHGAMLRVSTFAHMLSHALEKVQSGFGSCVYYPNETEFKNRGCLDIGSIFIKIPHSITEAYMAKAWLEKTVQELESMATHLEQ